MNRRQFLLDTAKVGAGIAALTALKRLPMTPGWSMVVSVDGEPWRPVFTHVPMWRPALHAIELPDNDWHHVAAIWQYPDRNDLVMEASLRVEQDERVRVGRTIEPGRESTPLVEAMGPIHCTARGMVIDGCPRWNVREPRRVGLVELDNVLIAEQRADGGAFDEAGNRWMLRGFTTSYPVGNERYMTSTFLGAGVAKLVVPDSGPPSGTAHFAVVDDE